MRLDVSPQSSRLTSQQTTQSLSKAQVHRGMTRMAENRRRGRKKVLTSLRVHTSQRCNHSTRSLIMRGHYRGKSVRRATVDPKVLYSLEEICHGRCLTRPQVSTRVALYRLHGSLWVKEGVRTHLQAVVRSIWAPRKGPNMTHYNRTLRELHQEPLLGNRTIANSLCVLLTTPEVHRLATLPLLTMMTRIMDNSFQKFIVGKRQIM